MAGELYNGWHHFLTITHHKLLVMDYCFQAGLYRQGLLHDLSKYSPAEFRTGIRYYQGFKSPNSAEREATGYSEAWLHHKGRNKHHFEYWIDIRGKGDPTFVGMPMPTRYVVEMFCDRIAACKVYLKEKYTDRSPLEYYEKNIHMVTIHPESAALLERMLRLLAKYGERKTLRIVREQVVRRIPPRRFLIQGHPAQKDTGGKRR
ncbi:MAG: catalase [Lachnospiraceae bacterium]|jgi:hypothetical protein|nr:catalase [Lachnospiraceae bacterium]